MQGGLCKTGPDKWEDREQRTQSDGKIPGPKGQEHHFELQTKYPKLSEDIVCGLKREVRKYVRKRDAQRKNEGKKKVKLKSQTRQKGLQKIQEKAEFHEKTVRKKSQERT